MRVFLSYSFTDGELHLITLLLDKLRNEGHQIDTSDLPDYSFSQFDEVKIGYSEFFVGIITNSSYSVDRVLYEYQRARQYGLKSILVVEDGVDLRNTVIPDTIIRFNRNAPQAAIDALFGVRQPKRKTPVKKPDYTGEIIAGAGIIAGVAALIALLSSKK